MTKQSLIDLSPSIILALGIMLATQASVLAAQSGTLILVGPLFLALAVVIADIVAARLRGNSLMPRPDALIMAGTFIVASVILLPNGTRVIQEMLPVMGITALLTSRQWTHGQLPNCAAKQS